MSGLLLLLCKHAMLALDSLVGCWQHVLFALLLPTIFDVA